MDGRQVDSECTVGGRNKNLKTGRSRKQNRMVKEAGGDGNGSRTVTATVRVKVTVMQR